jgi:alkylation response protein AidB-like acyl-CoA dehydrogenase
MDFTLSEEQQLLKDSVARFIEKEYDFESRRKLIGQGGSFSKAHWQTFAEMGWLMVTLPEDKGGFGGGAIETAIIMEEFGKGLVIEPFLPVAVLAARILIAIGENRVADDLLPKVGVGEARPILAHGEVDAFGEIAWVETRAERIATGWRLTGRKSLVVGAPFATHFLISARTSGEAGDQTGISLFIVSPDIAGLERIDVRLADSSRAAELVLTGVELNESALIGSEGAAYAALSDAYAHATIASSAEAVGAMDKALWTTRDYLKTRQQFGQPIGNFQALQHRMADMLIELEMARSQVFRALAFLNANTRDRDKAVSSMKVQIGRSAKFVGGQSIQLHGGIGVAEEYLIGHYFKRLNMIDNAFGTVGVHLDRMARLDRGAMA